MNKNRGCTDIICLIIFIAFLGSMGYLTFHAYNNGDVGKIMAPVYYDDQGNPKFCGYDDADSKAALAEGGNPENAKKYLYFTDLGPTNIMGLFK